MHSCIQLIVCNYANTDMVGHTGNMDAAMKAVETLDECLKQVVQALEAVGGEALITADHGNAELLFDEATGQPHTAHTLNPVPLIYVGRQAKLLEIDIKRGPQECKNLGMKHFHEGGYPSPWP